MANWVKDDGGRAAAGFTGETSDCVTRAIAIAGRLDYREVYDDVNETTRPLRKRGKNYGARTGVPKLAIKAYLETRGWRWIPTMAIGSGCRVHLRADELPPVGRYAVSVSKHLVALVDGRLHDTHDPTRDGTRCVYGLWVPPGEPDWTPPSLKPRPTL